MKKAVALLGGPVQLWPKDLKDRILVAKKNNDLIFASDRGSQFLLDMGIVPEVAIGDFDSLKKGELAQLEEYEIDFRYSHPEKDYTDSEQLFKVAFEEYNVDQLDIYGATGGRLDHFLLNIFTFSKSELKRYCEKIRYIDCQNIIMYILPGVKKFQAVAGYNYFAVGNLTAVDDLNISGAKYELKNYYSSNPFVFSSNEFVGLQPIVVSLQSGEGIIIYSKDINRFYTAKKPRN